VRKEACAVQRCAGAQAVISWLTWMLWFNCTFDTSRQRDAWYNYNE